MNVRIGMARDGLNGTYPSKRSHHDPLEVVVVYCDDGAAPMALVALDISFLSFTMSWRIRQQVATLCGLPATAIVTHCTHTHTGPWSYELRAHGVDALSERIAKTIDTARSCAEPVSMAFVEIDTGATFNMNRRQVLADSDTAFCIHMGLEYGADGIGDGSTVVRARLRNLLGREVTADEVRSPLRYDRPTDGRLQAVYFRRLNGEALGCVTRFAAHPTAAGHTREKMDSADYCGVIRRRMEAQFGGVCCFLTGPCGNLLANEYGEWATVADIPYDSTFLVPWLPQIDPTACWTEMARQGNAMADVLAANFPADDAYEPCRTMRFRVESFPLPLRDDFINDSSVADRRAHELEADFYQKRKMWSLADVKRRADEISFLKCHVFMNSWYDIGREHLFGRQIYVDLPALRLNDTVLMGFPGETFWETAGAARDRANACNLNYLSFTEANGDIAYIPTSAEQRLGGYETWCSLVGGDGEQLLADRAQQLVTTIVDEHSR